MNDKDHAFSGSIPQLYEQYLVPLIFAPYAADLAARVARRQPSRVLEIAAGTGVVTRRLATELPLTTSIVATDLNPPMLECAMSIGTARPVIWQQADAMALPFADGSVDAVVCQFGAMFFPDKAAAFAEARRVLKPGGTLFFNVWDSLVHNEFADTVTDTLGTLFPDDPPRFMARIPHGYHDPAAIARDLAEGGFTGIPTFETVTARSRAASARIVATAYCQGTPLRSEIEVKGPGQLDMATDAAETALSRRFGAADLDGKIQAVVVTVDRT